MANLRVYFAFLLLGISNKLVFGQADIKCTEDFCQMMNIATPCSDNKEDCYNATLARIIPSVGECNCCEHCIYYTDLGGDCINGSPGQGLPSTMCNETLTCQKNKCQKMDDPDLDPDAFPRYICDENTKRCRCVKPNVKENGKYIEIFGEFGQTVDIEKEEQCLCSLVAEKAKTQSNRFFPFDDVYQPTARCLPTGQFDPLQCIDGFCGCVKKATGSFDSSVKIVPVGAIEEKNPSCFDARLGHIRGQYYTDCETRRNQLFEELDIANVDGYQQLLATKLNCLPNGLTETIK